MKHVGGLFKACLPEASGGRIRVEHHAVGRPNPLADLAILGRAPIALVIWQAEPWQLSPYDTGPRVLEGGSVEV